MSDPNLPTVWITSSNSHGDVEGYLPDGDGPVEPGQYVIVPVEQMEQVWWCKYPAFNDSSCFSGIANPAPALAGQPRKHSLCGWRWLVSAKEEED